jgi:hypothetical protein
MQHAGTCSATSSVSIDIYIQKESLMKLHSAPLRAGMGSGKRVFQALVSATLLAAATLVLPAMPTDARAQAPAHAQKAGTRLLPHDGRPVRVTALYDGYIDLDPKLFKYTSAREVQRLLARMFVESTPGMQTAVNAYLVNTGSHLILVDTGASACFGPTLGRIRENLHGRLRAGTGGHHSADPPARRSRLWSAVQWHGGVSRRHCLCRQGRRGLLAR